MKKVCPIEQHFVITKEHDKTQHQIKITETDLKILRSIQNYKWQFNMHIKKQSLYIN